MNQHDIEEEAAGVSRASRADWSKIAAWTFGLWALMIPLATSIIVSGQNKILAEIQGYRVESLQKDSVQDTQIATIGANQAIVLRWKERLEQAGIIH